MAMGKRTLRVKKEHRICTGSFKTPMQKKSKGGAFDYFRTVSLYELRGEVVDWLNEHSQHWTFDNRDRVKLYDENEAFAFKMRWG